MNRVVGLETEYGCLTNDPNGPPGAISRVRNWIFDKHRYGLADLHQRDWDEPAGNGGFLFNGGRAYVDMGHLEYCTPECLSLRDLLRYDKAGDAILTRAVKDLRLSGEVSFIRNNVDHYSGATFGCHENYLVRRTAPLTETNVLSLLAFLTLRLLYAGAGKVGASPGVELGNTPYRTGSVPQFQISQRADYINNDLFEWVQFNRAIINTRDEPLADARKYRRLHLLHGDTTVLPTTQLLKIGTTSLVLDLLEIDRLPKVALADAVMTFHSLSHQSDSPWLVPLANGRSEDAVALLRHYYDLALSEFKGRDSETDSVLVVWDAVLRDLSANHNALVGKVDWITKRWLFEQFITSEQISWGHPWLKSQDLEFHHVDPARSLGMALEKTPEPWALTAEEITDSTHEAPANSRAQIRSRIMHLLKQQSTRYFVDWEVIDAEGLNSLNLPDPFDASPPEAEVWSKELSRLSDQA
ncbi:MAG: proteasome accessory factor PafA2 family protein [Verrucomicrobiota bacterium]